VRRDCTRHRRINLAHAVRVAREPNLDLRALSRQLKARPSLAVQTAGSLKTIAAGELTIPFVANS
jgi:hypothetical protein